MNKPAFVVEYVSKFSVFLQRTRPYATLKEARKRAADLRTKDHVLTVFRIVTIK